MSPTLSIVIPTYRRMDLLAACLESVARERAALAGDSELLVVDDGSPADVAAVVRERDPSATTLRRPANSGYSAAVQDGIERASGDWIAVLNDDTTLEPGALRELLAAARSRPRVGSVSAQIRFARNPGTINSAGLVIDRLGITSDRRLGRPVSDSEAEVTEVFGTAGTAALYSARMLAEIGGFDRSFYAHLEDADVAWRARMRGWIALYAPGAIVHHHHSATLAHFSDQKYYVGGRNRVRLLAKNADRGMLIRRGLTIALYDLGYVVFVALRDRTLAPLRGRLAGLREWRTYRRGGAGVRRPIELAPSQGIRGALRRRTVWSTSTDSGGRGRAGTAGPAGS